jgi:16S rRNA C967 or C1407 C5-methylase (RsmB/RsmF family)
MTRPYVQVVVTVVVSRDGALRLCAGPPGKTAALAETVEPASGTPTLNAPAAAAATTIRRWRESMGCIPCEPPRVGGREATVISDQA